MTVLQTFCYGKAMRCALACALFQVHAAGVAYAQDFPSKPMRIVVGFTAGGSNDIVARYLAPTLGELLGTQVVVENRPGANAIIGTEFVAKSAADGYTLLLGSVSSLVLNPLVYAKIPYDTLKDFTGLTTVAMTPQGIIVNPSLPVRSLKELIALAKSQPAKINFGSAGNGGLGHLTIELLKITAGINVQHIAYKGLTPALTDVLGGQIEGAISDLPAMIPHIKSGKLRALAVTSERRAPLLPDVPTAVERGFPVLLAVNWFAFLTPAKTPPAVVEKLHGALVKAATLPEMKERLLAVGIESATHASPEVFTGYLRDELSRWSKVVKQAGVHVEQ
jgi:tripartite-type tricarboxylate transporter receptor subunit TctC